MIPLLMRVWFENTKVATKFSLKITMLTFWTKFAQKECFWSKKSEHCHRIQHNQISLGIKFHLKLKILKIWTKFVQEGCFWSKTKKVNSIIEFNILELVQVSSFTKSWQFWFFRQNCPKQVISSRKQKKWTASFNSEYLN